MIGLAFIIYVCKNAIDYKKHAVLKQQRILFKTKIFSWDDYSHSSLLRYIELCQGYWNSSTLYCIMLTGVYGKHF